MDDDEAASGGDPHPTTTVADAANVNDNETTNGTAGSTPREDPTDGIPRKKARSGVAAVNRTKAVAAIKGGREAETLKEEVDDAGVDDDEVASGGRRRPTMATTDADAATPMTTRPRTVGAVVPRQSPTRPALMTMRSRAAGAAVPP